MARARSNRRRFAALCAAAALLGVGLLSPRAALANGRFPAASQLVVGADPSHIAVRATFGLVQSDDAGAHWSWICEAAMGYTGTFDPAVALTPNGAIVAGLTDGLAATADRGCTWSRAAAPLAGAYVVDVALDPADRRRVVAVTQPLDAGTPGARGLFTRSNDDGRTWQAPGTLLPEDFRALTVDVAPRGGRIYASGVGAFPLFGVIARSDDGGATWSETSFDMKGGRGPYISAIDPRDAARVYVRMDAEPGDRLLVSDDGAVTWKQLFGGAGDLLGFALSPDGTRVAVGGPNDGVHVASTRDFVFKKVSGIGARCLTWTAAGLYACADDAADGFTVGLSRDDGASWKALYHLAELAPRACPPGSAGADTCLPLWPSVADVLGPKRDAGPTRDASAPSVDSGGGSDAAPFVPPPAPTPSKRSCGCAVPERAAGEQGIFAGVCAAGVLLARRRTRGGLRGARRCGRAGRG